MNRRIAFWVCALLVVIPLVAQATIQQERDQIAVAVTINVTPAPVSVVLPKRASETEATGIIARIALGRELLTASAIRGRAESLNFLPASLLAQTNQKAVKVEAEVSPNPNGTLLYSDQTGVQITATAGTTVVVSCAYTVTVDTTITNWTLRHGVYNDFAGGFPGGDLANNTYISTATPRPTATPFVVYLDDGSQWTTLASNTQKKTYCVDLTITVPASVPGGSYTTNAVYTLYY